MGGKGMEFVSEHTKIPAARRDLPPDLMTLYFGSFDTASSALCAPSVTALLGETLLGHHPWRGKGRY
jgi:hypothetical protein